MMRRHGWMPIGLTLMGLSLHATTAEAKGVCGDCNVLWIVVDTTRADYIGAYGNETARTPTLDGLAARGLLFEHGYTQAPSTLISVSSYMSGRHRLNTGMDFDMFNRKNAFHPLSKENHTLAEALQGAGWKTWGATANLIIAGDVRFDMDVGQGFESWNKGNDSKVVDLAVAAQVKQVAIFHHDPMQSDADVDAKIDACRERAAALGAHKLSVFGAREGVELRIG